MERCTVAVTGTIGHGETIRHMIRLSRAETAPRCAEGRRPILRVRYSTHHRPIVGSMRQRIGATNILSNRDPLRRPTLQTRLWLCPQLSGSSSFSYTPL